MSVSRVMPRHMTILPGGPSSPCEVSAEFGELREAVLQRGSAYARSPLSEPVQQLYLQWREDDFGLGILSGTIDHRQPEDSPTQNTEHGYQIDQSFGRAQFRLLGAAP